MIRVPAKHSRPVLEFATIAKEARAMHKFLINYVSPTGKALDGHYALHHSQFSADPYNFFVVNPLLVGAKLNELCVVVNPEILEKDKTTRKKFREGCMSFPFRHGVDVQRYDTIKVKYQVPILFGKLMKTKEETISGLMARIFQHEIQHAKGSHIYVGSNTH